MEFNIVNDQEQIWSVAFGWHIVSVLALCQHLPGICVCSVALQQHGSCWWPRGPAVSSSYLCLCMRWFSHVLALCWRYNSMASSSMRKASPLCFCLGFFFCLLYLFTYLSIYFCLLIFSSTKSSGSRVTGACWGSAWGARGWVAGWAGQSDVLVPCV